MLKFDKKYEPEPTTTDNAKNAVINFLRFGWLINVDNDSLPIVYSDNARKLSPESRKRAVVRKNCSAVGKNNNDANLSSVDRALARRGACEKEGVSKKSTRD